ncbi:hypothetical protein PLICRDRAFT_86865 [Plicaturopsis crispa FD-325 SS-3]|nr:hypothetical protein PLICRDRAFT_86865 [Plicaturopsis crispa FD-325 SS-3]
MAGVYDALVAFLNVIIDNFSKSLQFVEVRIGPLLTATYDHAVATLDAPPKHAGVWTSAHCLLDTQDDTLASVQDYVLKYPYHSELAPVLLIALILVASMIFPLFRGPGRARTVVYRRSEPSSGRKVACVDTAFYLASPEISTETPTERGATQTSRYCKGGSEDMSPRISQHLAGEGIARNVFVVHDEDEEAKTVNDVIFLCLPNDENCGGSIGSDSIVSHRIVDCGDTPSPADRWHDHDSPLFQTGGDPSISFASNDDISPLVLKIWPRMGVDGASLQSPRTWCGARDLNDPFSPAMTNTSPFIPVSFPTGVRPFQEGYQGTQSSLPLNENTDARTSGPSKPYKSANGSTDAEKLWNSWPLTEDEDGDDEDSGEVDWQIQDDSSDRSSHSGDGEDDFHLLAASDPSFIPRFAPAETLAMARGTEWNSWSDTDWGHEHERATTWTPPPWSMSPTRSARARVQSGPDSRNWRIPLNARFDPGSSSETARYSRHQHTQSGCEDLDPHLSEMTGLASTGKYVLPHRRQVSSVGLSPIYRPAFGKEPSSPCREVSLPTSLSSVSNEGGPSSAAVPSCVDEIATSQRDTVSPSIDDQDFSVVSAPTPLAVGSPILPLGADLLLSASSPTLPSPVQSVFPQNSLTSARPIAEHSYGLEPCAVLVEPQVLTAPESVAMRTMIADALAPPAITNAPFSTEPSTSTVPSSTEDVTDSTPINSPTAPFADKGLNSSATVHTPSSDVSKACGPDLWPPPHEFAPANGRIDLASTKPRGVVLKAQIKGSNVNTSGPKTKSATEAKARALEPATRATGKEIAATVPTMKTAGKRVLKSKSIIKLLPDGKENVRPAIAADLKDQFLPSRPRRRVRTQKDRSHS